MMGFDVWSDDQCKEKYLSGCHDSPKYKKGQWWVLENNNKILLSSAITYDLGNMNWGVGSLATLENFRNNGYASDLLKSVSVELFGNGAKNIFLFADINSGFYEKQGFVCLPGKFQKYKSSTCMIMSEWPVQCG